MNRLRYFGGARALSCCVAALVSSCGSTQGNSSPVHVEQAGASLTAATANSSVVASPSTVIDDGVTTTALTVTILTATNVPVPNQSVALSASPSTGTHFAAASGTTNAAGVFTTTLTSTAAATVTVTATAGAAKPTTKVTFSDGPVSTTKSTFVAAPTSLVADGVTTTTLTATIKDSTGNPIPSQPVSISASGSPDTITPPTGATNASGVFKATLASTQAGVQTITLTAGSAVLSTNVTFKPGAPSAANTTLTASSSSVVADGVSTSALTVTVADANGNLIAGQEVTLSASPGAGVVFAPSRGPTNASGVFLSSIASTAAALVTITATAGTAKPTATVSFVPGAVSATTSTFKSSASAIVADGATVATLIVTLKDAQGNLVGSQPVSLSSTGSANTFTPSSGATDAAGIFTATLSSTVAQSEALYATSGAVQLSLPFTFKPGAPSTLQSSVVASPGTLVADGVTSAALTVSIADAQGNAINAQTVTLSASPSTGTKFTPASGTTNASGIFTAQLTSTHEAAVTITAAAGAAKPTTAVSFTPGGVSTTTSTFTVSPASVVADGVTTGALTVTLKDANKNPIGGQTVVLSGPGTANVFTPASGATNTSGVFTATIASTLAGAELISASAGGAVLSASITFKPGPASAATTTVSASPTVLASNGTTTSTITVTVEDAQHNLISGQAVSLAAVPATGTHFTPAKGSTGTNGIFTATLSSTAAATVQVNVTAGGAKPSTTIRFVSSNPCTTNNGGCGALAAGSCSWSGTVETCTCGNGYVLQGGTCISDLIVECEGQPDGTACNDFNACTQTDACQSGACVGSNPVTCTASDQCHAVGVCNPSNGQCSNPAVQDGTSCNDGNACTDNDSCTSGVCAGTAYTCAAPNSCQQAGTCNGDGTCSFANLTDGTACPGGTCSAGACVPSGCFVNSQCGPGKLCLAGSCVPVGCSPGLQNCQGACVNLLNDPNNCGGCGQLCAPGSTCSNAMCVPETCSPGLQRCQGACVNLLDDPNNCGTCFNTCHPGQTCSGAACVSPSCSSNNGGCGPNASCTQVATGQVTCTPCAGSQVECNGACTDETSDPDNCGACGTSCGGGACSGSVCLPVARLATSLTAPYFAVDSNSIYIVDATQEVRALPISGGPATPLGAARGSAGPSWMAVDSQYVYWTEQGLNWLPITGGAVSFAWDQVTSGGFVAASSGQVFWDGTSLAQIPAGGGAATLLASVAPPFGGIAAGQQFVYWADINSGNINKVPIGGGPTVLVANDPKTPFALVVDASESNIYWRNQAGDVVQASLSGGATIPLAAPGFHGAPALAVDNNNVYFNDSGDGIDMVPIGGGARSLVATSANGAIQLAVDETSLYWTDSTGQLLQLPFKCASAICVCSDLGTTYQFGSCVDSCTVNNGGCGPVSSCSHAPDTDEVTCSTSLASLAVSPATPTIQIGQALQLTASATYSSGVTLDVTSSATWTASPTTYATVSAGGLVTGLQADGPVASTIVASFGGVTGSTTVAVAVDPCETNNGGCGIGGVCSSAAGVASCSCLAGYTKDAALACVDGCTINNGGCGAAAVATCSHDSSSNAVVCGCAAGYSLVAGSCLSTSETSVRFLIQSTTCGASDSGWDLYVGGTLAETVAADDNCSCTPAPLDVTITDPSITSKLGPPGTCSDFVAVVSHTPALTQTAFARVDIERPGTGLETICLADYLGNSCAGAPVNQCVPGPQEITALSSPPDNSVTGVPGCVCGAGQALQGFSCVDACLVNNGGCTTPTSSCAHNPNTQAVVCGCPIAGQTLDGSGTCVSGIQSIRYVINSYFNPNGTPDTSFTWSLNASQAITTLGTVALQPSTGPGTLIDETLTDLNSLVPLEQLVGMAPGTCSDTVSLTYASTYGYPPAVAYARVDITRTGGGVESLCLFDTSGANCTGSPSASNLDYYVVNQELSWPPDTLDRGVPDCTGCPGGYHLDNFVCIDDCTVNNGGCTPPASFCGHDQNKNGDLFCACPIGQALSGSTCVDLCSVNNGGCPAHSACAWFPEYYSAYVYCSCNPGYYDSTVTAGAGENPGNTTCTPINNCAAGNYNGCSPNATCTDTGPGTNTCACNPGYLDASHGAGTSCLADVCQPDNGGCGGPSIGACSVDLSTGLSTCACGTGYGITFNTPDGFDFSTTDQVRDWTLTPNWGAVSNVGPFASGVTTALSNQVANPSIGSFAYRTPSDDIATYNGTFPAPAVLNYWREYFLYDVVYNGAEGVLCAACGNGSCVPPSEQAVYLEVSSDGGKTWSAIASETLQAPAASGTTAEGDATYGPKSRSVDLSSYAGANITIRFRVHDLCIANGMPPNPSNYFNFSLVGIPSVIPSAPTSESIGCPDSCSVANGGCGSPFTGNACAHDLTTNAVSCECGPGSEFKGGTCIDACNDGNNGGCDPQAACGHAAANYATSCTCHPPLVGNGTACYPNQCLNANPCDAHASCAPDNLGDAHCACNSGYVGTGLGANTCFTNACEVNNGGCAGAICTPSQSSGSPVCSCAPGLALDNTFDFSTSAQVSAWTLESTAWGVASTDNQSTTLSNTAGPVNSLTDDIALLAAQVAVGEQMSYWVAWDFSSSCPAPRSGAMLEVSGDDGVTWHAIDTLQAQTSSTGEVRTAAFGSFANSTVSVRFHVFDECGQVSQFDRAWFTDVPLMPLSCVNPCSLNNGGCDQNAICGLGTNPSGVTTVCACSPSTTAASCDHNLTCVPSSGGAPECSCNSGFSLCGQSCVNETIDSNNCGGCGAICEAGTKCENRACVADPCLANNGGCAGPLARCTSSDGVVACACAPGDACDVPTNGRFLIESTYCAALGSKNDPSFDLYVGNTLVANATGDTSCQCIGSPTAVVIANPPVLAQLTAPGTCGDFVRVVDHDPAGQELGFVKVEITRAGSGVESICLLDAISGGNCGARPLCTYNSANPGYATNTAAELASPPDNNQDGVADCAQCGTAGGCSLPCSVNNGGCAAGVVCTTNGAGQAVCGCNASSGGCPFVPVDQGPDTFTLTLTPPPGGTITDGALLDCGAGQTQCTMTYVAGAQVTFQATPASGYGFAGWGGNCSGTALSCAHTMVPGDNIVASFVQSSPYLLTIAPPTGGRVSSSDGAINCGDGQTACTEGFDSPHQLILTETPDTYSSFTGWGGSCGPSATSTTCAITVAQSLASVTVSYVTGYLLTVSPGSLPAHGTITSNDSAHPISCGSHGTQCSQLYTSPLPATLTFAETPDLGYTFVGWSGACAGSAGACTLTAAGWSAAGSGTLLSGSFAPVDLTACQGTATGPASSLLHGAGWVPFQLQAFGTTNCFVVWLDQNRLQQESYGYSALGPTIMFVQVAPNIEIPLPIAPFGDVELYDLQPNGYWTGLYGVVSGVTELTQGALNGALITGSEFTVQVFAGFADTVPQLYPGQGYTGVGGQAFAPQLATNPHRNYLVFDTPTGVDATVSFGSNTVDDIGASTPQFQVVLDPSDPAIFVYSNEGTFPGVPNELNPVTAEFSAQGLIPYTSWLNNLSDGFGGTMPNVPTFNGQLQFSASDIPLPPPVGEVLTIREAEVVMEVEPGSSGATILDTIAGTSYWMGVNGALDLHPKPPLDFLSITIDTASTVIKLSDSDFTIDQLGQSNVSSIQLPSFLPFPIYLSGNFESESEVLNVASHFDTTSPESDYYEVAGKATLNLSELPAGFFQPMTINGAITASADGVKVQGYAEEGTGIPGINIPVGGSAKVMVNVDIPFSSPGDFSITLAGNVQLGAPDAQLTANANITINSSEGVISAMIQFPDLGESVTVSGYANASGMELTGSFMVDLSTSIPVLPYGCDCYWGGCFSIPYPCGWFDTCYDTICPLYECGPCYATCGFDADVTVDVGTQSIGGSANAGFGCDGYGVSAGVDIQFYPTFEVCGNVPLVGEKCLP